MLCKMIEVARIHPGASLGHFPDHDLVELRVGVVEMPQPGRDQERRGERECSSPRNAQGKARFANIHCRRVKLGAQGEIRTRMVLPASPSSWCVYQFHHLGEQGAGF